MAQKFKNLIGKRILFRSRWGTGMDEIVIIEATDQSVKLKYESGATVWRDIERFLSDYDFFEVLP